MAASTKDSNASKINGAIDITKLIMAILVIGIHTEPFGFHFWLDKGFAICTRLCVPFFFVASAYFFWRKEKSPTVFLQRIATLYVVWSIIYLPSDIPALGQMTVPEILRRFLWTGNVHALWYLCGSIIGFIITAILLKFLKPRYVLIIGFVILVIGTAKSTYSVAIYERFGVDLPNHLGPRNGLFYGFPYIALGMAIAKSNAQGIYKRKIGLYAGLILSLLLLAAESYLFTIRFKAASTILWLSVFPYTYFFFEIVLNKKVLIDQSVSLFFRKMSTLMYVSHSLFVPALRKFSANMSLFILAVLCSAGFSILVIKLSEKNRLRFLQYLY